MTQTVIRGKQVLDGSIQRADLDTSTVGQAVVTKLVQGTNITLSSTGADSGTGDVTINASGGAANNTTTTTASFTIPAAFVLVTISLNAVSWGVVGQALLISDGTNAMYCQLYSIGSSTSWTVQNLAGTGYSTSGTMASGATITLGKPDPFQTAYGLYNEISYFDDFDSGSQTSMTSGNFLNWATFFNGTAAALTPNAVPLAADTTNYFRGCLLLSTGTTATGQVGVGLGNGMPAKNGPIEVNVRVAFFTLPTSLQNTTFLFGIADAFVSPSAIYMGMSYQATPAVPVWFIRSYGPLTDSAYVSSPAPVAYSSSSVTFFKIRLVGNATWTTWNMWVNNVQTHTNVSLSLGSSPQPGSYKLTLQAIKTAGTTASSCYIDKAWFRYRVAIP